MTDQRPKSSRDALLNELEAIQALLDEHQRAENKTTPAAHQKTTAPPLLDLGAIFEGSQELEQPSNPEPTEPPTLTPDLPLKTAPKYNFDLLVQEVVDELLPVVEAKLRAQLEQLGPEIIQQLARQFHVHSSAK